MSKLTPLEEQCRAYDRMSQAIEVIGNNWRDWPDLRQCAQSVGLSASHFQREFSRWAGVSPRQYQAALAHSEAGELLRAGASVLETAHETGLSGPGRLHDLFIAHEGLSPGEAKSGGADETLKIGRAQTPFGAGVWLSSDRGLVALGFIDDDASVRTGFEHQGRPEHEAFADLMARYPAADFVRDDAEARRWAELAFEAGKPIPLALYGTEFRRHVWRALLDIPAGKTETYGSISQRIGRPKAQRATGAAVGANPLSWFIPCHRALSASGKLHNYHWGLKRKRSMLTYERVRAL